MNRVQEGMNVLISFRISSSLGHLPDLSFEKMQDKLFKFKNMVAEYITDDKIVLEKFNQYNNDNIEIISRLFVAKNKGKTTMDKN